MAAKRKQKLSHSKPQQIGSLGEDLVKTKLPPSWAKNELRHDFGKDLLVETSVEDITMSGDSFFIQVKSSDKVHPNKKGFVSFRLETRHAAYYLDQVCDLPVFLVIMETSTGNGWWLFLQPYLRQHQAWRDKEHVTIYVPISNRLQDWNRLASEVKTAKRIMKLAQADSISDAIAYRKKLIEEKDPRFTASISVVDGKIRTRINPLCEVNVKFTFRNESKQDSEKYRDLIGRGKMVSFAPGEVSVEGTPLFDSFMQGGGSLQFQSNVKATGQLIAGKASEDLGRLSDIRGRLTGGRDEFWFDGETEGRFVKVKLGPITKSGQANGSITPNIDRWFEETVCRLSYFDQLAPFFSSFDTADVLRLQFSIKGNHVFEGTLNWHNTENGLADFVRTLKKVRFIFNHLGTDATIPDQITDEMYKDIDVLYEIIKNGAYQTAATDARITCTGSISSEKEFHQIKRGPLKIEEMLTFNIFDVKISGKIDRVLTSMAMTQCKMVEHDNEKELDVEFRGDKTTTCTWRMSDADASKALTVEPE